MYLEIRRRSCWMLARVPVHVGEGVPWMAGDSTATHADTTECGPHMPGSKHKQGLYLHSHSGSIGIVVHVVAGKRCKQARCMPT